MLVPDDVGSASSALDGMASSVAFFLGGIVRRGVFGLELDRVLVLSY